MIRTRLPVWSAIALIVAMIFNCGGVFAGPNQTSADYVMPGCRDAASLITFSNVGESEEQVSLTSFCAGIVVGLSFMGQPYCARGHDCSASRQYRRSITDSPPGFTRTSTVMPFRLREQIGRVH